MTPSFDETTLRNIANVLGSVLTNKQISEQFKSAGIMETGDGTNKPDRIYYSLFSRQKQDNCGNNVLDFIIRIITPKRYSSEIEFERDRTAINEKLLYDGIEIDITGSPQRVSKAKTISEAKSRSVKIKQKIQGLVIHRDIMQYCEAEALQENYFHAILEITKSVAETLRQKSGYYSDGNELVDACFGLGLDKRPMLAFNTLQSQSDESEHKGFANFVKGFFSMYRNPKAHSVKIKEETQLSEMSEVLVVATIIHNRLDKTFKTGYKTA